MYMFGKTIETPPTPLIFKICIISTSSHMTANKAYALNYIVLENPTRALKLISMDYTTNTREVKINHHLCRRFPTTLKFT